MTTAYTGCDVFDGETLHPKACLLVEDGIVTAISKTAPEGAAITALPPGILAPGFLDLQVNGGGGQMVGPSTDLGQIAALCAVHAGLGATVILPTLITDRPEVTARVLQAGIMAAKARIPGFLGLHLEGPHLDPRRKGAHDAALIRAMTDADMALYLGAARDLPALMITLAPASATARQVQDLTRAGIIVSIGHAEATAAEVQALVAAGARSATHLFNAMSQLTGREPGVVGAVLGSGIGAGLIADGHHVAIDTLRVAMAARPKGLYLVSDCMAVAGTDLVEFTLGGRRILRQDGRLTLADGTLAGADLTLPRAVKVMVEEVGVSLTDALTMVTSTPAALIGASGLGRLGPGLGADFVHLSADLGLTAVWRAGQAQMVS